MTTLAEHIIVAGAENRPPMLEKSMCDSWASRVRLFIKRKKNDVYALVNHQEAAKDIWDRVKLLIKGTQQSQAEFPQLEYGLAVPTFQQGDDLIDCINNAMAFLSVVPSRFPPSNNQLRTYSNPRNQATIQDGTVTV
nr:hypothetical protein [Tanacetum cinerariifolium]